MPIIPDKSLKLQGNTEDEVRDFQLAWLNRRVEFLEDVVFELLRDKVNYEVLEGYRHGLKNPGFAPSTLGMGDRSKMVVGMMHQDFQPEDLGWPAKNKWEKDEN